MNSKQKTTSILGAFFLLFMLSSCGGSEIIGKTTKIGNIEIAEKDFPTTLTWEEAEKACSDLGEGWRLPTIEELKLIFENKNLINGIHEGSYWSSSEGPMGGSSSIPMRGLSLKEGWEGFDFKINRFSVRAVRDI
jgi:hypothetical protein